MALTPPAIEAFEAYKGETFDPDEYDAVEAHLQAATDLMEIATRIHTDFPVDTLEWRVMQRGILDAAWFIGTSMEDRDAMFSPFSTERIGSYSYSKMSNAAALRVDTGIPFFDYAVKYLAGFLGSEFSGIGVISESVMPGQDYYRDYPVVWHWPEGGVSN